MKVGMEKSERASDQGDHQGAPLLCLRSGLPGSSIVGAHPGGRPAVGPGCGGNRLSIAFASRVLHGRPWGAYWPFIDEPASPGEPRRATMKAYSAPLHPPPSPLRMLM